MLPGLALLLLCTVPKPAPEFGDVDHPASHIYLHVGAGGGAVVIDQDTDILRSERGGLGLGVHLGVRADRPPITNGGGRLGFMATLHYRHFFGGSRNEWYGAAKLVAQISRVLIMSGVGYGMSAVGLGMPRPMMTIHTAVGLRWGAAILSLTVDLSMQLASAGFSGRTMDVGLAAAWEFELFSSE